MEAFHFLLSKSALTVTPVKDRTKGLRGERTEPHVHIHTWRFELLSKLRKHEIFMVENSGFTQQFFFSFFF